MSSGSIKKVHAALWKDCGMEEPLKNGEFYAELNDFNELVGDREITALLAGLYARHILDRRENKKLEDTLEAKGQEGSGPNSVLLELRRRFASVLSVPASRSTTARQSGAQPPSGRKTRSKRK